MFETVLSNAGGEFNWPEYSRNECKIYITRNSQTLSTFLGTWFSLDKDIIKDPAIDKLLLLLLKEITKDAVYIPKDRKNDVYSWDELAFTSKLLPYVISIFQKNYLGGMLEFNTATWNVFHQTEDGE